MQTAGPGRLLFVFQPFFFVFLVAFSPWPLPFFPSSLPSLSPLPSSFPILRRLLHLSGNLPCRRLPAFHVDRPLTGPQHLILDLWEFSCLYAFLAPLRPRFPSRPCRCMQLSLHAHQKLDPICPTDGAITHNGVILERRAVVCVQDHA